MPTTDTDSAVTRRTVVRRSAAGVGGALVVGAAASDEAAAALCFEATTDSPTYDDACPLGSLVFTVSAGEQGPATGRSCTADDGTSYVEVDWDSRSTATWIDSANVESVHC